MESQVRKHLGSESFGRPDGSHNELLFGDIFVDNK